MIYSLCIARCSYSLTRVTGRPLFVFKGKEKHGFVELSHVLNDYLDELSPIEDAYTLDISSLGAEKPLKIEQLPSYINSYIHVHLINPINGENIYEGTLVTVGEDNIIVEYRQKTRTKTVDIQKSNISKIRLAIKF